MEIRQETRTYKLTGTESLLGSCPANPEVYSQYVGSKTAALQKAIDEEKMLPAEDTLAEMQQQLDALEAKGLTVFLRNGRGELCLSNHIMKGYLKAAAGALKDQLRITAYKSRIDNLVFVRPTYLTLCRDGEPIKQPDGINERPLRAMTMQGERVALAASEEIEDGWELTFSLTLVENSGTARSSAVTFDMIEMMLDYGALKGLGQWRNGGHGGFTWERVE